MAEKAPEALARSDRIEELMDEDGLIAFENSTADVQLYVPGPERERCWVCAGRVMGRATTCESLARKTSLAVVHVEPGHTCWPHSESSEVPPPITVRAQAITVRSRAQCLDLSSSVSSLCRSNPTPCSPISARAIDARSLRRFYAALWGNASLIEHVVTSTDVDVT